MGQAGGHLQGREATGTIQAMVVAALSHSFWNPES